MLPLEDNFGDVISKAQRGLKLEDAELAHAAGVPVQELTHAKAGTFSLFVTTPGGTSAPHSGSSFNY